VYAACDYAEKTLQERAPGYLGMNMLQVQPVGYIAAS
jgi:hypothetical protein